MHHVQKVHYIDWKGFGVCSRHSLIGMMTCSLKAAALTAGFRLRDLPSEAPKESTSRGGKT